MEKVLITGINGQDGSYLAEYLLDKGFEVHGTLKRNSVSENQTFRLNSIYGRILTHYADLTDLSSLVQVVKKVSPSQIYNLAHNLMFEYLLTNRFTLQLTGLGTLNLLESVRLVNKDIRVYQASSSEMFGNSIDPDGFQRETTSMNPVSPYGCAKVFSYNICRNYRNSYNMFISNGILFNHESPRRGTNFVTNKVCKEVAKIKLGLSDKLLLGNLSAKRDWGHAKDYVEVMHLIMKLDKPNDFVCATGISHSVEELCDFSFRLVDLNYKDYVEVADKFLRPEELDVLKGDSSKLRVLTGWKPKYTFESMIEEMVKYWIDFYKK